MAAVFRLTNAPSAKIVASSSNSTSSRSSSGSSSSAGLRCRGQSRSNSRLLTRTVPQSPPSSQSPQKKRNQLFCSAQAGAQPAASDAVTVRVEVPQVQLGSSGVSVPVIGVGAWAWGDKFQWNDGEWNERKAADAKSAFDTSLELGLNFIDTAEVYGKAQLGSEDSETLLGRFIKESEQQKPTTTATAIVATKFAALPWRLGRSAVVNALKTSLQKLQLDRVDLYQLHWPGLWGNEGYIDGLADCVELGLTKAVGVSNYNEQRLRKAHKQLASRGVTLASNQVHYNILYRIPEQNGVKAACDELGVTLITYSPLAQGILSGKYSVERPPTGPRAASYSKEFLVQIRPVLSRMRELGAKYGDRTLVQVALNWLVTQGNVVPIPGAKSRAQVEEFKGALGWSLTADEVEELRQLASKVPPVIGFPAERL